ncbi:MAG: hypothetical protein WBG36_03205 [Ornithinimicrobium sp.]
MSPAALMLPILAVLEGDDTATDPDDPDVDDPDPNRAQEPGQARDAWGTDQPHHAWEPRRPEWGVSACKPGQRCTRARHLHRLSPVVREAPVS